MLKRMTAGAALIAAGNGAYAASQWFLTVVVARQFGAEGLGTLALALAITAPLQALANLATRHVYVVDKGAPDDFIVLIHTRIFLYGIFLVAIALTALWSTYVAGDVGWILVAAALLRASEGAADACNAPLNKVGNLSGIASSSFLRSLACTAGFVLGVFVFHEVVLALLFASTGAFLMVILHDLPRGAKAAGVRVRALLNARISVKPVRELVRRALPLGFGHALVILQPNIPRYALEMAGGRASLGIFSAFAVFVAIGNLAVTAINQAILPSLANALRAHDWKQSRILFWLLAGFSGAIGAIGLIAALAFGPWLILFIYGPEFAQNDIFFSQMMAFAIVAYLSACVGNLATATGQFRGFALGYGVVTLLSAILSFKLIPAMGISGAILIAALISLLNGMVAYGFYRRWRRSLEPLA